MQRMKCTGVSLKNSGISLDNKWYTVVGKAANYLKLFHNGDDLDVNIEEDNGKPIVTFIQKITTSEGVTGTNVGGTKEGFDKEEINGAEFGLCCKQAVGYLAPKELTWEAFKEMYPAIVKYFWQMNKNIKNEL